MKNIFRFLLTTGLIVGLIALINYILGAKIEFIDIATILLFTLAYGFANYLGILFITSVINQIFNKKGQEKAGIIAGIIFSALVSLFVTFLVNIIFVVGIKGKTIDHTWKGINFIFYYLIPLFISVIITLINYVSRFYKRLYEGKNQKQELVIQKISSQYEGLQQQLSPHFLFNSLNVLDSLIDEDPKAAHEFTQELSNVYRYVLEQQANDFVTINEELKFVENYISLMNKRFEGMVEYVVASNIDKESKVFPMSIQLLIENAFKHNKVTENNPLKIEIYQNGEELIIKNNLSPKQDIKSSSKKGLVNIQARYQKLNLVIKIKKTEKEFEVHLPIINKNFTIMEYTEKQKKLAKKRVKEIKKFYKVLNSYVITVVICTIINLLTSWNYIFKNGSFRIQFLWVIWVIFPWGIIILSKAIKLFWLPAPYDWVEKKIQEFLQKNKS